MVSIGDKSKGRMILGSNPGIGKKFIFYQNVRTDFGAHISSYSVATARYFQGYIKDRA